MNRNANFICFFVIVLCAAFCGVIYLGNEHMSKLKEELESLTNEYNGLQEETNMMVQRRRAYVNAFNELDKLKVGIGENVDFYSEAQQAIRKGGARVLSNSPNPPRGGRISMRMSFIGDYYSVMKALAELRGLPNVVRVVSLTLKAPNISSNEINADVLLEALSYR